MTSSPQSSSSATRSTGLALKGFGLLLLVGVALFVARASYQRWSEDNAPLPQTAPSHPAQPVRVVTAQAAPIQAWVFSEGTSRSVNREYLTFEMSGRVTFVGPEKAGTPVKKGEVLAQLDKRRYLADVESALADIEEAKTTAKAGQADVGAAETQYELAMKKFERVQRLYQQNASTESDLDVAQAELASAQSAQEAKMAQAEAIATAITTTEAKLRQAKIILEEAEIVSPIDGIVAYRNIEKGFYFTQEMLKTGSESEALQSVPFVVIDPSQYEITVDVPAFEAGRIRVGQEAMILPGGSSEIAMVHAMTQPKQNAEQATEWFASGKVFSVNPAVNPGGRSVQVRIRTTSGAENLRDGMFVTSWIATEQHDHAVQASFDAFLYEENRPYVFAYLPDSGTVERRNVELGIQGFTSRQILSGVSDGEQLVTTGRYRLVDGAPVRILDDLPPGHAGTPPGDTLRSALLSRNREVLR